MQPVHGLEPCSRCRIYHCKACGCLRDGRRGRAAYPNTELGNMAYVEHRLPPQERVTVNTMALAGLVAMTR